MSLNYYKGLKKTQKYHEKNQLYLKTRVFNTLKHLIKAFYNDDLKSGQFLLDLGSSDNSLVKIANDFGMKSKGLDIVDLDLEKDKIDLSDNTCDIVTAISLIEHLHRPENFLQEVKRVLKKNGYFIIITPDWSSNVKHFFDDPTHYHPYSRKSLRFVLELNDFRQIKILPWLVCKPAWMWKVPFSFLLAKMIPFTGNAPTWIPSILKGRSKTLLSICVK